MTTIRWDEVERKAAEVFGVTRFRSPHGASWALADGVDGVECPRDELNTRYADSGVASR
jgi:hypothetical protein